jgi:sterol desaturase/sphingolipid hydroxylase (fatty acid hydroxylase superfamily)
MKDSRNANYSSILTIWDSIFFTYKDAKIEDRQYLGLDDRSKEFGLIQYIRHPFIKDR